MCLDWLSDWGRTRAAARRAYAADVDACFGQSIASPWGEIRGGLVLGGEKLWGKVKRLLAGRRGEEELAWGRRVGREETAELIERLAGEQEDGRVAIWVRVRLGGQSVTELARKLGYANVSGISRVVERVEERARGEEGLRRRLEELRGRVRWGCECGVAAKV